MLQSLARMFGQAKRAGQNDNYFEMRGEVKIMYLQKLSKSLIIQFLSEVQPQSWTNWYQCFF